MSLFSRLKSFFNWSATAPALARAPVPVSTRRPAPATEERVPARPGGPSARFFFLPYPDSPYSDPPEIKAAMRLMLRDPYVKSAWLSNVLTVAAQDIQVHASDDNDPLAKQEADFARRCLENAEGGVPGLVTAILNPLGADGYSLCEKVWQVDAFGLDRGRITLRKLKAKRPDRVRLHGDRFDNVTGVRSVLDQLMWPITDFVYTRYLPVYDEADGIAPFRAAYAAYWMHDTVRKLRIIHHEKKIGGMLVGTYTDPNDKPGLDEALAAAKTATWMSVPEGVRIKAEQISTASDTEYAQFVADCRTDMVTGITFASLQILEGQTPDARGDSKVQKSISDLAPWYLTYQVTEAINRQLIPDLIDFNFPRVPVDYPKVSFGAVSNQELLQECDLIERAQRLGFKPSKKHYSRVLTIQEADPLDPSDAMTPAGQGGLPGMPGMPGMPGDPSQMGQQLPGGGDPFALPPPPDPSGMDPMAQDGQPEGLFADRGGQWVTFSWQQGKRGGRYWLPAGKPDEARYRLYGAKAEAAARAAKEAPDPKAEGATSSGRPEPQTQDAPAPAPQQALADAVAERIRAGQPITARQLFEAANKIYGGTRAAGSYGPSQAYDALEAGLNAALVGETDPTADTAAAVEQARRIAATVATLPTQTNRSGNKDAFQQFSTPPHLAFAAAWLANLKPTDTVLEPSAGTGSIAVHAKNAGATVHGNELDPARAALLKALLGDGHVTEENAEQIGAILRGKVSPTAVVMNPPFSATAGRLGDAKDLMTATRHIDEALALLPAGGRLVAIVGEGMVPPGSDIRRGRGKLTGSRYADWFGRIQSEYSLRANVGVPGSEYAKMGTQFGTRVLVIDKAKGGGPPVTGDAADVPGLMEMLADVRNSRPGVATGLAVPQGAGGAAGPAGAPAGATGRAGGRGRGAGDAVRAGLPAVGGGTGGAGLGGPGLGGGAAGPAAPATGDPAGTPVGVGGRAGAGRKRGGQPAAEVPGLRPAVETAYEYRPDAGEAAAQGGQEQLTESAYATYTPAVQFPGARRHESPLVESAAMAAVRPPAPTYKPHLSPDVIEKGLLSDAALETLVYAGQAHSQMLPGQVDPKTGAETPPARRGFFIGDGTGVGKSRQIAAIIADNANQGRRKAVWVTKKSDAGLTRGANAAFAEIGEKGAVVPFQKFRDAEEAKRPADGTILVGYDTLKAGPEDPSQPTNLDVLEKWLGKDFDGVIAFDEAHLMGSATGKKGLMGETSASDRALAGLEMQRRFPNARVVYASATGATELSNLAYAERLGLWGPGTAFPARDSFISGLEKGGVAAMEAVAQSLKASGLYSARTLSLDDGTPQGTVKYDRVVHHMSDDQRAMYDAAAEGWQVVMANMEKVLDATGAKKNGRAVAAARGKFWGAQQRFFDQLMTSIQTPTVLAEMEKDIKEGRSPVVQLVKTNDAQTQRAIKDLDPDQGYEDVDISPRQVLLDFIDKAFPTQRYEEYLDADGNRRSRVVLDSNKVPVEDPEAVKIRDDLKDRIGFGLRVPDGPLDQIVRHFGTDVVAEATGRPSRLVPRAQPDGTLAPTLEKRGSTANAADAAAFQAGKKKVMVFSNAGGTGLDYHADKRVQNQGQRMHYMLQPGWQADVAVQGLGRTHRTNQVSAPQYRLVQIDGLDAQKRFVSTIARRLDQLGALTKGQRETGSSGLFKAADNLESAQAAEAMEDFFDDLERGRIPDLPYDRTATRLGFPPPTKVGEAPKRPGRVTQFLNRLLSLPVSDQKVVFGEFEARLADRVRAAVETGKVDTGMANFPAQKVEPARERVVYTNPTTGAQVKLHTVTVTRKIPKRAFDAPPVRGTGNEGYVTNDRSGGVWEVYPASDGTDTRTGRVFPRKFLVGPSGSNKVVPAWEVTANHTAVPPDRARAVWEQQYAALPDTAVSDEHFVSGAVLDVWDRLPEADKPKIWRVKPDGKPAIVGRQVPKALLGQFLKDFGVEDDAAPRTYKVEDVHKRLAAGASATLAGGWSLAPARVQGEQRVEVRGVGLPDMTALDRAGAIKERVGYATRYFVPTGPAGVEVLRRLTLLKPLVSVTDNFADSGRATPAGQSPLPSPSAAVLAAIRGDHARSRRVR